MSIPVDYVELSIFAAADRQMMSDRTIIHQIGQ
jgi:hypothetical protein